MEYRKYSRPITVYYGNTSAFSSFTFPINVTLNVSMCIARHITFTDATSGITQTVMVRCSNISDQPLAHFTAGINSSTQLETYFPLPNISNFNKTVTFEIIDTNGNLINIKGYLALTLEFN